MSVVTFGSVDKSLKCWVIPMNLLLGSDCMVLFFVPFYTKQNLKLFWVADFGVLGVQGFTTITYRRIQNFLESFLDFAHVVYVHCLNERLSNKHLSIRILGCNLFRRKNSLNSTSKMNWEHGRKVDWVRYLHYHKFNLRFFDRIPSNIIGHLRSYLKENWKQYSRTSETVFTRHFSVLNERFLYDLEMKTRKQNRNNERTEIERFDWFIERIQTRVAFGWLSERSGEKTSCPRTF